MSARGRLVGALGLALWLAASSGVRAASTAELLAEADALLLQGQFRAAEARLQAVRAGEPSLEQRLLVEAVTADIAIAAGQPARAARLASAALADAQDALTPALRVRLLDVWGVGLALQGDPTSALERLQSAAAEARRAGLESDAARALANATRVAVDAGLAERAGGLLAETVAVARGLPDSAAKASVLLSAGRLQSALGGGSAARLAAHDLFRAADAVAVRLDLVRLHSYAVGYLGELYAQERRFEDALALFRRAVFLAQRAGADEALYRWEWGSGRALDAQGRSAAARAAYQRAVNRLETLRHQLPFFYGERGREFERTVEPVYFALVQSQLDQAGRVGGDARQSALRAARDTMELLKVAELRNYFGDDCVQRASERSAVDALSPSALVIYPIALPERLELLVTLPDGRLRSFRSAVSAAELDAALERWRALLEKRITREYLTLSQRLYRLLVAPLAELLTPGVDTLVFVPHGTLAMVPMAALHDGEHYLIERLSVAVTPGLELTSPGPLNRDRLSLLLAGLSQPVDGYPGLSHVPAELGRVGTVGPSELLLDDAFRRQRVSKALASDAYNVVHIATHGEFAADTEQSFLLAYDGRLSMGDLERFVGLFRYRQQPLELLTLSACETAAGDRRAAMGLSGIAVKAGARSAVGTLWRVNDQSSARLMEGFYAALARPGTSRAAALREAQLGVLDDLRYWHPGYWSAFLLISDWL